MAQSILKGHYRALFSPLFEVVQTPMPGYPVLLIPFVLLFGPLSFSLKIFSMFMVLAAGVLLAFLSKQEKWPPFLVLSIVIYFLFNSTIVPFSSFVMSEPTFLAFSLLGLALVRKKEKHWMILSGLAFGWSWLIRPQGILLVLSVGLALWRRKKIKQLFTVLGWAFGVYFLIFFLIWEPDSSSKGYRDLLLAHILTRLDPAIYFNNLKATLGLTFPAIFYQIPVSLSSWARSFIAWGTILVSLGAVIFTVRKKKISMETEISLWFCLSTFLLLPFWFGTDTRYVLILFPFLVFTVLPSFNELLKRKWRGKKPFIILMIVLLTPHLMRNAKVIQNAYKAWDPAYRPLPEKSFRWITENIDPAGSLLSLWAPTVYLYSKRKTLSYFDHTSLEEFRSKTKSSDIGWIFIYEWPLVSMPSSANIPKLIARVQKWIKENPDEFELVYSNPLERANVWKIKPQ